MNETGRIYPPEYKDTPNAFCEHVSQAATRYREAVGGFAWPIKMLENAALEIDGLRQDVSAEQTTQRVDLTALEAAKDYSILASRELAERWRDVKQKRR